MTTTTVRDLYVEAICGRADASAVGALARALKALADEAWDKMGEARVRGDDLTAAHQQGRAYALCEALGDQAALAMDGAFDTTNVYGWSNRGFDPDKNEPSWRQYLVDACEFAIGCEEQGAEGFKLATIGDLWLAKLRKHPYGFVPASLHDMRDLADVVDDYTEYEQTNGRSSPLVSWFASVVLRGEMQRG